ncbi:MAG TPA: tRNA (adenosine(37)-N6)-dimethylallyltransferase MiaA [Acidimicrobiales bacterium]
MSTPGRHAALVGPTASGKSHLALGLARRDPTWELVSADSMQVYRGMDIGTAKPTLAEQADVPHHAIDLLDPWEDGTVVHYQRVAREAIAGIEARGRRALLVGGTGLYIQAVVDDLEIPGQYPEVRAELEAAPDTVALHGRLAELDPLAASRMEPTNRRRVLRALEVTVGSGRPFSSFGPGVDAHPTTPFTLVGLAVDRDDLASKIAERYAAQMSAGFLNEVIALRAHPKGLSRTAAQALGYRELLAHLRGETSLDEALELATNRTRQFARRQRSWFGRDPRITWLDAATTTPADLAAHLRQ